MVWMEKEGDITEESKNSLRYYKVKDFNFHQSRTVISL